MTRAADRKAEAHARSYISARSSYPGSGSLLAAFRVELVANRSKWCSIAAVACTSGVAISNCVGQELTKRGQVGIGRSSCLALAPVWETHR
jgi:hypothetical protein